MKTIVSIIFLFLVSIGYGQSPAITFEALPQKLAARPRPILIKIHATWCAVCRIQDKKIEKDAELQKLLRDECYFLELDAEDRKTIRFNNTEYRFLGSGTGGMHSLAAAMANPKDGYPTWVLLDAGYNFVGKYSGLVEAEQLKELLKQD
ncbi:thioredoxin family protein [uncultured Flavobacterium sp.]|uniref:thioredoxin family protein n=1 Tax=uncultured Flavobacterium sp. TaxID=165435 RepID=UPI0025FC7CEB|nr:thioredoxin family protein [uncultured Flavobacterium sp.]